MPQGELTPEQRALLTAGGLEFKRTQPAPSPAPAPPDEPCLTCEKKASVPGTEPGVTPTAPTAPSAPYPHPPSPAPPTAPTSTWDEQAGILRKQLSDAVLGHQPPPVPAYPPTATSPSPRTMAPPSVPAVAPRELLWSQLGVGYVNMPQFARPMLYGGLSGFMRGVPRGLHMMPRDTSKLEQAQEQAQKDIDEAIDKEKKEVDGRTDKSQGDRDAINKDLEEIRSRSKESVRNARDLEEVRRKRDGVVVEIGMTAEKFCLMWVNITDWVPTLTNGDTSVDVLIWGEYVSSHYPVAVWCIVRFTITFADGSVDKITVGTDTHRAPNQDSSPYEPGTSDGPREIELTISLLTEPTLDYAPKVITGIEADVEMIGVNRGGDPLCKDTDTAHFEQ